MSSVESRSQSATSTTQHDTGRVDFVSTTFASASDLSKALRRAEAANGEHETRIAREDPDWPEWYAEYIVREQAGEELPA